nr:MarR family transcriptional regulator [Micromonospora sp. DSM 115978]
MQQEIRPTFRTEIAAIERELMLVNRHSVLSAVRRQRPHEGLERSAYVLLSRIEAEGPMSISDLAEAFGLAASTVNRQTAAMLRAGLVERILDPDGGLARKLAVTEHGLSRLHQDREYATSGLAGLVADWDP